KNNSLSSVLISVLFMKICNKYWIVSLSVVLCFGLVLPICAHAEMQRMSTHQNYGQERTAHNHDVDCTCGHQLAEALQIIDIKPLNKLNISVTAVRAYDFSFLTDYYTVQKRSDFSLAFNTTGPPLHLLNCVFLK